MRITAKDITGRRKMKDEDGKSIPLIRTFSPKQWELLAPLNEDGKSLPKAGYVRVSDSKNAPPEAKAAKMAAEAKKNEGATEGGAAVEAARAKRSKSEK